MTQNIAPIFQKATDKFNKLNNDFKIYGRTPTEASIRNCASRQLEDIMAKIKDVEDQIRKAKDALSKAAGIDIGAIIEGFKPDKKETGAVEDIEDDIDAIDNYAKKQPNIANKAQRELNDMQNAYNELAKKIKDFAATVNQWGSIAKV